MGGLEAAVQGLDGVWGGRGGCRGLGFCKRLRVRKGLGVMKTEGCKAGGVGACMGGAACVLGGCKGLGVVCVG